MPRKMQANEVPSCSQSTIVFYTCTQRKSDGRQGLENHKINQLIIRYCLMILLTVVMFKKRNAKKKYHDLNYYLYRDIKADKLLLTLKKYNHESILWIATRLSKYEDIPFPATDAWTIRPHRLFGHHCHSDPLSIRESMAIVVCFS